MNKNLKTVLRFTATTIFVWLVIMLFAAIKSNAAEREEKISGSIGIITGPVEEGDYVYDDWIDIVCNDIETYYPECVSYEVTISEPYFDGDWYGVDYEATLCFEEPDDEEEYEEPENEEEEDGELENEYENETDREEDTEYLEEATDVSEEVREVSVEVSDRVSENVRNEYPVYIRVKEETR